MKSILFAGVVLGFACSLYAAENKLEFKDEREKNSYAIGVNIGTSIKRQEADLDLDLLTKGIRDAFSGSAGLTDAEVSTAIRAFQAEVRTKMEARRKVAGEKNKAEGEKFLEENAKKEGVKTTESGLQYKVIREGTGPVPQPTDQVVVKYRGTTIDGKEFDSTEKRGEPAVFTPKGLIKGWGEALQMMNVGSKWEIYIPSALAYGERGHVTIEPNATLIFDVELLEIKPPVEQNQPVTSDIIKVPSKEELDKGAKIEVIKPDQLQQLLKTNTNKPAAK
ncbi:MAG: FKBP-type peptidyl-prolyl cis-trans isomerase [Verrucomicrobiota bacterium]|nr:FKBP-type peptidyl-prolyl cis-trans isomerase [Verrucomicrobiota bacterium]